MPAWKFCWHLKKLFALHELIFSMFQATFGEKIEFFHFIWEHLTQCDPNWHDSSFRITDIFYHLLTNWHWSKIQLHLFTVTRANRMKLLWFCWRFGIFLFYLQKKRLLKHQTRYGGHGGNNIYHRHFLCILLGDLLSKIAPVAESETCYVHSKSKLP